jgi:hypothetical protein
VGGAESGTLDGSVVSQDGGPDLYLVYLNELRIEAGANISVVGSRVLAIVATGDAIIAGELSVVGQGTDCASPDGTTLGHGGGGGAFGDTGGAGSDNPAGRAAARGNPELIPLLEGCAGGQGSGSSTPDGGAGGGALQISAAGALEVAGVIDASGLGGRAAQDGGPPSFAGGGGAGGGILLEGSTVKINGAVLANGGGGGGGYDGGTAQDGHPGSTDGLGGESFGGNLEYFGGAGGTAGRVAGDGNAGNGAGGGGSVGRIRVNSATAAPTYGPNSTVSPMPSS